MFISNINKVFLSVPAQHVLTLIYFRFLCKSSKRLYFDEENKPNDNVQAVSQNQADPQHADPQNQMV